MKKFLLMIALLFSSNTFAVNEKMIEKDQVFNISVIDGNNSSKSVQVKVLMDGKINQPISKKYINSVSEAAFNKAKKSNLKNEYSFKPREVIVEQVSDTLEFIVKYTAENSYGADVVNEIRVLKFLGSDRKYHDKPE
ncbi:hypothetical protein AS4_17440 [Acinetobacter guillouiae]|jgi:hypothetical protein|uniref:hypothetical protein n=1 Tax=Acinetobacter guillouiae TaxID=106649 RepID=UPI0004EF65C7|nr:hypothetical protein [Acinetobacter guillouiae]BAP36684.1 hypothetical protein AS4_17440 [Acinetobacter guillouiae]